MGVVLLIAVFRPFARFRGGKPLFPQTKFHWNWCIVFISIFLSAADFVYFYALSLDGAMISIVSMVRRGSVVVSFLFGAWLFHEKNLKSKIIDLALVLLGMLFLYIGSH
jgi:drug/metabolite transporter (DMT)-like permease